MKKSKLYFAGLILSVLFGACTRDAHFTKEDANLVAEERPGAFFQAPTVAEDGNIQLGYYVNKVTHYVAYQADLLVDAAVKGKNMTFSLGGIECAEIRLLRNVPPQPSPCQDDRCHEQFLITIRDAQIYVSSSIRGPLEAETKYVTRDFINAVNKSPNQTITLRFQSVQIDNSIAPGTKDYSRTDYVPFGAPLNKDIY